MSLPNARLRWGILGVARNNRHLLPAFAKSSHIELRAIASRSPESAQTAAAAAGIPTAYGGYEALFDDPDIERRLRSPAQQSARRMNHEGPRARKARPL